MKVVMRSFCNPEIVPVCGGGGAGLDRLVIRRGNPIPIPGPDSRDQGRRETTSACGALRTFFKSGNRSECTQKRPINFYDYEAGYRASSAAGWRLEPVARWRRDETTEIINFNLFELFTVFTS